MRHHQPGSAFQVSDQGPQPHRVLHHDAALPEITSGSALSAPAFACPVTHPLVRQPYAPHPCPSLGLGACRKCNATIQSPSAPERERDLLSNATQTTTVKLPMEHATLPQLLQQGMSTSPAITWQLGKGRRRQLMHCGGCCGPLCRPVEGLGDLPQARGFTATQHTHPHLAGVAPTP
jgi:hypothetical protein